MLPALLSPHALLIAVIFGAYLILMAVLGAYIWRSGQPRDDDEDPARPDLLPMAA